MNMLLGCLCINGLMKICPKSSRISTSTGEIVMNIIHEMLMTFMFYMEDSTFGDLV